MIVKEYLKDMNKNTQIAFLIKEYDEERGTFIYRETPIRGAWEWELGATKLLNSTILNDKQDPISDLWKSWVKLDRMKCLLIKYQD